MFLKIFFSIPSNYSSLTVFTFSLPFFFLKLGEAGEVDVMNSSPFYIASDIEVRSKSVFLLMFSPLFTPLFPLSISKYSNFF